MIPFLWSGAGSVVTRLGISQAESRHRVTVITSGASKGFEDWPVYRNELRSAGISHVQIDLFDREADVLEESVERFTAFLRDARPDIVHCHSGVPAAVAGMARERGFDFRLIGQLHSWGPDRPDWMNRADLEAFGRSDVVIANSADYRKILRDGGIPSTRIVAVPWGIPLDAVSMRPPSAAPAGRGFRIGFTGRIERRKGQAELVESLARLREIGVDATLELIGPVAEEDYAREVVDKANRMGVTHHLRLLGAVDDVYAIVREWDVFASASADEGQGMAVLEAMALGVPVVSTDVAGVRDFLRGWENAVVVRLRSPAAIAAAVKWVLEDPALGGRLVRNARRTVERGYGWDQTVARMDALYDRLVRAA